MKLLSLLATCLMLALPTLSGAAIVSTTTSINYMFDNFANSYSSADPTSGSIFLDAPDIVGLNRFDPALGTLNAVSVAVVTDMDVHADIYDSGGNEFAEASGLLNFNFELVVWDSVSSNGSSTIFFPSVFNNDTVSCMNDGVECLGSVADTIYIDEVEDITGAFSFNMADFIGTGLLDPGTLTFGVAYPEALSFTVDGAFFTDDALVDILIEDLGGIDVTVIYDFTPVSAVPLPGAFWLMLSGGGLLLGALRRRRGS